MLGWQKLNKRVTSKNKLIKNIKSIVNFVLKCKNIEVTSY